MRIDLSGLTAVVTGASSGIGLATARLMLAAGANVAICGRDGDRLAAAEASLGHADRLLAARTDVLQPDQVSRFAQAVTDRFGGADILVNNAGQARMSTFADTDDAAWRDELDLKFFSIIHPTRAFHPLLARSDHAAVVCVNSLLARQPEPHLVATSAARAGVLNLARSLAAEFAADGIRVNSILLGLVDSGQWRRRYDAAATEMSFDAWMADVAARRGIPMGRLGKPDEPARAILFLASPAASYTTGATLDVSGGLSRHA